MSRIAPRKIGLLAALYFAQGLPFGFQANALGLYLTALGLSMERVSLARALALPWLLKALWAPFVDRLGNERFGRRKSWIVPMQVLLALTCAAAAFVTPKEHLMAFLLLVLLMNLFAATQDVAVDGLAVDVLEPEELGAGNGAQVVGYKIGMAVGGGVLVAASAFIGWRGLFLAMAGLYVLITSGLSIWKEPPVRRHVAAVEPGVRATLRQIVGLVRRPGAWALLLFVGTYKTGETLADAMFGPYLVKVQGLTPETVAGWLGGWGIVGSILGSLAGAALASRASLLRAVFVAAALRAVPLVLQLLLVTGTIEVQAYTVVPLAVTEHFFGGVLTTCMFAFMMSQVDRSLGATHFTLLASVEVLGKAPAGLLSGFLVSAVGFGGCFAVAVALSVGFLGLFAVLERWTVVPSPSTSR